MSKNHWFMEEWPENSREYIDPEIFMSPREIEVTFELTTEQVANVLRAFEKFGYNGPMTESTKGICPKCAREFHYHNQAYASVKQNPQKSKCPDCGLDLILKSVRPEELLPRKTSANHEVCNLTEGTKEKAHKLLGSIDLEGAFARAEEAYGTNNV